MEEATDNLQPAFWALFDAMRNSTSDVEKDGISRAINALAAAAVERDKEAAA